MLQWCSIGYDHDRESLVLALVDHATDTVTKFPPIFIPAFLQWNTVIGTTTVDKRTDMADIRILLTETSFKDVSVLKTTLEDFLAFQKFLAPPVGRTWAIRAGPKLVSLISNTCSIKERIKSLVKPQRCVHGLEDRSLDVRKLVVNC